VHAQLDLAACIECCVATLVTEEQMIYLTSSMVLANYAITNAFANLSPCATSRDGLLGASLSSYFGKKLLALSKD
jgi:hypothetical protein